MPKEAQYFVEVANKNGDFYHKVGCELVPNDFFSFYLVARGKERAIKQAGRDIRKFWPKLKGRKFKVCRADDV